MLEKILIGALTLLITVFFAPVFILVNLGRLFGALIENKFALALFFGGILIIALAINLIAFWAFDLEEFFCRSDDFC